MNLSEGLGIFKIIFDFCTGNDVLKYFVIGGICGFLIRKVIATFK